MRFINLRTRTPGGLFVCFSLHFPFFVFLKIKLMFFKGKREVCVSEINGKNQRFCFLPGVYMLCGMATTKPQLVPSTAAPYSWPSVSEISHCSRPQK